MIGSRGRFVPIVEVLGATIGFPDEMPLDQIQGVIGEKVHNVKAFSNFVSRADYHPGLSWGQIKEMGLSDLDIVAIMSSPVPVLGALTDVAALADHERRGDDVAWWEWALSGVGLGAEAGAGLAIFAGIKAAKGNTNALGTAKDMAMDGLSRDDIWKKTGWFEDVDGHWKFEINDSGMSVMPAGDRALGPGAGPSIIPVDINKHLTHEELLRQYPDISGSGMSYTDNVSMGGYYNRPGRFPERYTVSGGENVYGKHDSFKGEIDYGEPSFVNPEGTRSVMGHELQHGVQQREGFAQGGSPDEFSRPPLNLGNLTLEQVLYGDAATLKRRVMMHPDESLGDAAKHYKDQGFNISNGAIDLARRSSLEDLDKLEDGVRTAISEKKAAYNNASPYQQYMNLAGEAEARNVQTRMNMTAAERAAIPPWETLDVPESDLVVRFEAGGMSASEARKSAKKITAYRDKTWYHGSGNSPDPIRNFDPALRGSSSGAKDAKDGVYFGGRQSTAAAYLEEYDDIPDALRGQYDELMAEPRAIQKQLEIDYPGKGIEVIKKRTADPRYDKMTKLSRPGWAFMEKHAAPKKYGSITEAKLSLNNPYLVDMAGEPWDEALQLRAISEAKDGGYDGVIFENMQDSGWFGGNGADDIALVFDESQINVTNAPKITAYHGSPHDFDKFTTEAIGTGEGAQAYGHGLYFAESEDVARGYRDTLTPRDLDYEEELLRRYNALERSGNYEKMEMYEKAMLNNTPADFRDIASDLDYDDDYRQMAADMADEIEELAPDLGAMYQVEIDASPDEFLDWDLPLSEQSGLGEKLKRMGVEIEDEYGMSGFGPTIDPDGTTSYKALDDAEYGGQWLEAATRATRGDPGNGRFDQPAFASSVSDRLKKSGIKGIRYKDANSRGKEGGTSNYVVFDENLISIARKYGLAIPAAAAMLARQTGQNPQDLYEDDSGA